MTQPPPPPPGWPPSTGGSFNVGSSISYGWTAYWRNVGPMMLLTLVVFVVDFALSALGSASNGTASLVVLQLLGLVVGIILAMGLIRASLAITAGKRPSVSMLTQTEGFGYYLGAFLLLLLGIAVGFVLLIVPGIIVLVACHLFGFVIVEDPATRPVAALRRSAEITRGHRWPLLGLILLLGLINIAGALACGVGLLFTYGITAISLAHAYRTLSGQPIAPV